jgi:protein ImuB
VFACIHLTLLPISSVDLVALAQQFSPLVERISAGTVVCSVAGLDKLIGPPHQIATEIARCGSAMGIQANLAIASNPDTAVLAAVNLPGVTVIPQGKEAKFLGNLPVGALPATAVFLETLDRWGITTLADLAALPVIGLVERLGEEGERMQHLVLGETTRPLQIAPAPQDYTAHLDLDQPLALLEPLLFVLSSLIHDLVRQLKHQALATNRMTLRLALEDRTTRTHTLGFPLPVNDTGVLLKQAQLDLEAHPPGAAVVSLEVQLDPVKPRVLQGGLFRPAAPEPDKLHILLARIAALVGKGRVGSPEILDTHQPDAYAVRPSTLEVHVAESTAWDATEQRNDWPLRLSSRLFRPALVATVKLTHGRPAWVLAPSIKGAVVAAAGPWRTSGGWWASTVWARDEWDVGLDDGALYRIYQEMASARWFVDGVYD